MKKLILSLGASTLLMVSAWTQTNVSGVIVDAEQQPIQGVSVQIEGTSFGTISNFEGYFELENFSEVHSILQISHIGFKDTLVEFTQNEELSIGLETDNILVEEAIVRAVRAGDNTPTTFENMNKVEIMPLNDGRDIPVILQNQTSVVTHTEAGNGFGYTGLRIRGISQEKINVTINGIALNDAESHEVYWVNIPDLAGSIEDLQIQRGVGSSTNGAGAFGGSINITTKEISQKAFSEVTGSAGSFNSFKTSVAFGTGLINKHWFLEGKFTRLGSDGYRDRASSDLISYFAQGGYQAEKTIIKAIAFGGRERTYQAWYGIPDSLVQADRRQYPYGQITNNNGEVVDYYDDFVDNYGQDHYQVHISHKPNNDWTLNGAIHYTYGRGYYEDYLQEAYFSSYGLSNNVVGTDTSYATKLVQRLWLDNDYYGATGSAIYNGGNLNLTFGGAYNIYDNGRHFGEITWIKDNPQNINPGHKYYENVSEKHDGNLFAKMIYRLDNRWSLYADAQIRSIDYKMEGSNREWWERADLDFDNQYFFFNPKAGVKYNMQNGSFYGSIAKTHREPTRSDFVDGDKAPEAERLTDIEVGIKQHIKNLSFEIVGYRMLFRNELLPTGRYSVTGSEIRENVGKSTRTGVEILAQYHISNILLHGNTTISENTSEIFDLDNQNNNIKMSIESPYSPGVISNFGIDYILDKSFRTGFTYQYVGEQTVQNVANSFVLPAYNVVNFQIQYKTDKIKKIKDLMIYLNVYNVLNNKYSSKASFDGWTFPGIVFFPQAEINFMMGTRILF